MKKNHKIEEFNQHFLAAISNDFNISQVLALVWEVTKSNIPSRDKYELILSFDEVLGLGLGKVENLSKLQEIPVEVQNLILERDTARSSGDWDKSDMLRDKIKNLGFEIKDTENGTEVI